MSEHLEVRDILGPYILEALDSHETREVEDHLMRCASCRAEEHELRQAHEHLIDLAGAMEEPPLDLEDRVLGRLTHRRRRWPSVAAAAVLAVVALVTVLYTSGILGRQAIASTTLEPTGRAPDAGGEVRLYENGDNVEVTIDAWGLPRCKEHEYYEVWFVEGDERVSGGSFTVGSEGNINTRFNAPKFAENYPRIGITSEVAGDPRPSDNRLLAGDLSDS